MKMNPRMLSTRALLALLAASPLACAGGYSDSNAAISSSAVSPGPPDPAALGNLPDLGNGAPVATPAPQGNPNSVSSSVLWGASGPVLADIVQGATDDCWLLSMLGSFVAQDPNLVTSWFAPSADGNSVTVTLYDPNNGTRQSVDVALPITQDPNYAAQVNGHVWVNAIEQAVLHVGMQDGQAAPLNGGSGQLASMLLTGRQGQDLQVKNSSIMTWLTLSGANRGTVVAAGTDRSEPLGTLLTDKLLSSHMYSVLGTQTTSNGTMLVHLRDPYGPFGPPTQSTDGTTSNQADGDITISYQDFSAAFTDLFTK